MASQKPGKDDRENKSVPPTPDSLKPNNVEDLGNLDDLGEFHSMTMSALADAVMGDKKEKKEKKEKPAPKKIVDIAEDDDDDALGLGKPMATTSGPPSGILRPSTSPEDDALSLDIMPTAPNADAPLSFVARSDIALGHSSHDDDEIAKNPIKPTGKQPGWFTGPKSSSKTNADEPKSGSNVISGFRPNVESSDIFTGAKDPSSRAGDSNLLSVMAGSRDDNSNILTGNNPKSTSKSDLFGDSRILQDSKADLPRPNSDILSGSRASSDILAGSKSTSDILTGSSLFDEPEEGTDRINPQSRLDKSIASPDQFVPLFDEPSGSEIVLNNPMGSVGKSTFDEEDQGLISFDIPKKKNKPNATAASSGAAVNDLSQDDRSQTFAEDTDDDRTSFMPIPEDEEEEDAMAAEFLGSMGGRSGVNLLDHQETMSSDDPDDEFSEDVFNARTLMDIDLDAPASGVNLLAPGSNKIPTNPKSESIFSGPPSGKLDPNPKSGGSELVRSKGPNSPASIFGPETGGGPSSAIFPPAKKSGGTDPGRVSFDLQRKSPDATDQIQQSSLIDWAQSPGNSDQITQRTDASGEISFSNSPKKPQGSSQDTNKSGNVGSQPFELEESDSVFDVNLPEDASTESQLFKAEQYARAAALGAAIAESGIIAGRSGKLPKIEPISSRTKFIPPPPAKRSNLGWLGGTAAGLLAGVGISSGAFYAGLIPGGKTENTEVAAIKQEYDSKLQRATAEQNQLIEQAKVDASNAAQQEAKAREDDLKSKLATANSTAKAANDAKLIAEKSLDKAKKDAEGANSKVDEARNELTVAVKAKEELAGQVAKAMADVKEKSTAYEAAQAKLVDAEKTASTATAALTTAVNELKSANLIDAKLDLPKSIAALPDAIKKAAAGGSTPDGKKLQELTEKLIFAQKDAESARKLASDAKSEADKKLQTAKTEADLAITKLNDELKTTKTSLNAEIQKAMANSGEKEKTRIEAILADLKRERDERTADQTKFEAKMSAQAEEFRQQLASARAGVQVASTDVERAAAEKANRLFGVASDAYFEGRYNDAIQTLREATKLNPSDARAWYYLGLSQWMIGDRAAAAESYKTASQWEARSASAARSVGSALERVQGPARQALDSFRP